MEIFVKHHTQFFLISFDLTNTENLAGLFLQVSKISFAGFIIFLLLFQQFNVGSEAFAGTIPDTLRPAKDTSSMRDSALVISADTMRIDSIAADTNATDESLKFPVKYHARDSIRVNIADEIVYLYGAATVDYDDMHLDADYIVIDMNGKELFAEGITDSLGVTRGSPRFSQAEQKFRSSTIRYNFDSKKGKIGYVITQEGEGYIHGEVVKKDAENNFYIKKGQYTTCDRDIPHFAIQSNRLKVISNNKIVTGPAYLTIEGVSTPLLLPFGFFPNKKGRSSGIIFPSFGESTQRGFYFQNLGYYFGFSDYATLELTTDVYTKGSYTLNGVAAYKKRYHYSGNLGIHYAYTVDGDKDLPGYTSLNDYRINWTHVQDPKLNPNSNFSAKVNAGSSSYYSNTIASTANYLTNTFESAVSYSHHIPDKPINYGISLNHKQYSISRDVELTLPDFSFNVSRINPLKKKIAVGPQKWYEKIGVSYSLKGTNTIKTKDSLLFAKDESNNFVSLDSLKNGFMHAIPFSTSFNVLSFVNLSPSINYTERWYFKTTQYSWNTELQKVDTFEVKKFTAARDYQVSVGLSTRVYGMYQFHKGKIVALRHVMTPNASLSYRPDFGEEKYGYYKTVQVDTLGRQKRYSIFQNSVYGGPAAGPYANLGFSLDNNIEMKVKTDSDTGAAVKKVKIFESLRLGAGYNLIADSMKLSLINLAGRTSLMDKVTITFGGTFDPYDFDSENNDYDQFSISNGGPLVRLTNANLSLGFSLSESVKKQGFTNEQLDYYLQHPEAYVDFNVPFNMTFNYIFNYSKHGDEASSTSQTVSINGDLSLTPLWKIGFNSAYDFEIAKFTNMGLNIYRDLHCWEMRLNWIPFGYQESWNFQINVKSSILQDLKLKKEKEFYDN